MKRIFLIIIGLICAGLWCEIMLVDYKNSEFSNKEYPSYIKSLFEKDDETKIRKMFDIPLTYSLIYAKASGETIDEANSEAKLKALSKASKEQISVVHGLQEVTSFWQEYYDDTKKQSFFISYRIYKQKNI